MQQEEFIKLIRSLKEIDKISSKSRLLNINPYSSSTNLLRVGGRLRHANFPSDIQHPIIIPRKGRLTKLVIEQAPY